GQLVLGTAQGNARYRRNSAKWRVAKCYRRTPVSTTGYPVTPATVPNTAPVRAVKAKRQSNAQFIYQSHCPIDGPMKPAIYRMAKRLRITESSIHRMALVYYLATNDTVFAREGQNNAE